MSYRIHIIDQNTGNGNKWNLWKYDILDMIENLIKTQKQSEIIIIEKR